MPTKIRLGRRVLAAALLAGVSPMILEAQRVAPALDVGASSVRYADSIAMSATTLSSALRIESSNATAAVSLTHSRLVSGGRTTQGAIAASKFVPLGGRFHGEVVAGAGGSAHYDDTRTGQLLVQGRGHVIGAARGFWLGGGLAQAWDGLAWHGLKLADAGAWASTGGATLLASVAPTSVTSAGQASLRYTDASAAARWVGPRAELGASLGTRVGRGLPVTDGNPSTWGSVSAVLWVAGPVALAASAGSYPIDYTQGFPGGRFATLALRLERRPISKAASSTVDTSLAAVRGVALPESVVGFAVGHAADGTHRTLVVSAPAATLVEVTGDFTGWQPVRLARRGADRWAVTLPMLAGTHEIAVRVDGGAWVVPPGLTMIRDEFGGLSGILVIR